MHTNTCIQTNKKLLPVKHTHTQTDCLSMRGGWSPRCLERVCTAACHGLAPLLCWRSCPCGHTRQALHLTLRRTLQTRTLLYCEWVLHNASSVNSGQRASTCQPLAASTHTGSGLNICPRRQHLVRPWSGSRAGRATSPRGREKDGSCLPLSICGTTSPGPD